MKTRSMRVGSISEFFVAIIVVVTFQICSASDIQTPLGGKEVNFPTKIQSHPLKPPEKMTEVIADFEAKNPPLYTVQVYRDFPGEKFTEPEERTLAKLCEVLMKQKPEPVERISYFSWIKDVDCPIRFRSWGCMLREAKPVQGGWIVTLQAMARATDSEAHPYVVYDRFIEIYEISDVGNIRYVRGYPHPEDGGGKPHFRRVNGL